MVYRDATAKDKAVASRYTLRRIPPHQQFPVHLAERAGPGEGDCYHMTLAPRKGSLYDAMMHFGPGVAFAAGRAASAFDRALPRHSSQNTRVIEVDRHQAWLEAVV